MLIFEFDLWITCNSALKSLPKLEKNSEICGLAEENLFLGYCL